MVFSPNAFRSTSTFPYGRSTTSSPFPDIGNPFTNSRQELDIFGQVLRALFNGDLSNTLMKMYAEDPGFMSPGGKGAVVRNVMGAPTTDFHALQSGLATGRTISITLPLLKSKSVVYLPFAYSTQFHALSELLNAGLNSVYTNDPTKQMEMSNYMNAMAGGSRYLTYLMFSWMAAGMSIESPNQAITVDQTTGGQENRTYTIKPSTNAAYRGGSATAAGTRVSGKIANASSLLGFFGQRASDLVENIPTDTEQRVVIFVRRTDASKISSGLIKDQVTSHNTDKNYPNAWMESLGVNTASLADWGKKFLPTLLPLGAIGGGGFGSDNVLLVITPDDMFKNVANWGYSGLTLKTLSSKDPTALPTYSMVSTAEDSDYTRIPYMAVVATSFQVGSLMTHGQSEERHGLTEMENQARTWMTASHQMIFGHAFPATELGQADLLTSSFN